MLDPRIEKLADLLVNYSNQVKKNEKILIIGYGLEGLPLVREIYKKCVQIGAHVKYDLREDTFGRIFFEHAQDHQLDYLSEDSIREAENTDAMFQIIADKNKMELAKIDQEKMIRKRKATKKLSDILHDKRWVLFEYPTASGAQDAGMSLEAWEDFTFNSCLVDWEKASQEQEVLKEMIESANEVRIVADGTDLTVDITGQKAVKCCGRQNMPDGEVFTSPVKSGVNGYITYNTPTMYMNKDFNWIKLTYKDGKVVESDADKNQEALEKILDTDPGSRYLGEFAFGTNRNIQTPVKSILFDEKIGGSNHMALGKCYEDAPNGNDSNIHWDLIIRHKEASGKVYMDGELIQENGVWVHPKLKGFN